jgi:hypothetical protein
MNHDVHDEIDDHEECFLITQSSCPSIVFVAFVARTET